MILPRQQKKLHDSFVSRCATMGLFKRQLRPLGFVVFVVVKVNPQIPESLERSEGFSEGYSEGFGEGFSEG
jgi:hypothetical protein